MTTLTVPCSQWKNLLDEAADLTAAEAVIQRALLASREELLEFLHALFLEYVGPDGAGGGCNGTRDRIQQVARVIHLNDVDLEGLGLNPHDFRATIFSH
ncbi:MAG: hypothetical protein A2664_01855 [Candidatus Taylorbacteria bacterium RIFCSPHIGHO2_01_FULL_46_22b]|uniref:Uncharacterized protein n=1 Tax=Candidatus Taylorbacteria bacterium RIFCSPHIGHO2_01_FULL_46_22b TaxID=1802301 RepID=A0A1G2M356_9BACT|nr:MAG: hypothetical protein A2664_01855 [Candidatus Taylorbacteria bacterium RIFCSPHIGHO2_01_FULL_46_22b]